MNATKALRIGPFDKLKMPFLHRDNAYLGSQKHGFCKAKRCVALSN